MDEHRVLADPAEPGSLGVVALQDRAVVDVRLHGGRRPSLADQVAQATEPILEFEVVVASRRVTRENGTFRIDSRRPLSGEGRRGISHRDHDECATPGQRLARIQPPAHRVFPLHPAHVPVAALAEPLKEGLRVRGRDGGSETDLQEAQGERFRPEGFPVLLRRGSLLSILTHGTSIRRVDQKLSALGHSWRTSQPGQSGFLASHRCLPCRISTETSASPPGPGPPSGRAPRARGRSPP